MSESHKSRKKKPVSEKQLAANRANAAQSTGPKTPEGLANSSRNACKHGLSSADFTVIRLEDIEEIDRLRADLIAVYQPRQFPGTVRSRANGPPPAGHAACCPLRSRPVLRLPQRVPRVRWFGPLPSS